MNPLSLLIPMADELSVLGFAAVLYPVTLLRLAMKAIEAGLGLSADEGTQAGLLEIGPLAGDDGLRAAGHDIEPRRLTGRLG